MLAISLLFTISLSTEGGMSVSLNEVIRALDDGGYELELCYEIPYSSLTYLENSSVYEGRFQVGIQLLDSKNNPRAGDVEQGSVQVHGYDLTTSRDSVVTGSITTRFGRNVVKARVEVRDLVSGQSGAASFRLDVPMEGVQVRLLNHNEEEAAKTYGLEDTVVAEVVLAEEKGGTDSVRFLIKQGRQVLAAGTRPLSVADGGSVARFRFPVADSTGRARLGSGDYRLEIAGTGSSSGIGGGSAFKVRIPFYFDDEAYMLRVDELLYIASTAEMRQLKAAQPKDREPEWRRFWDSRDPIPATGRNEKEDEYFERIDYSREHFAHGDKGYRSERARVYVRYGPPDHRETRPFEVDQYAYEIWSYYGSGLEFVFVDRYGFGEYALESPTRF